MTTGSLQLAYFGRDHEPLSAAGLSVALSQPGIEVVSVTAAQVAHSPGARRLLTPLARRHGVPVVESADVLARDEPADVVLSVSNPIVFDARFLESLPLGALNLHPAPLPGYRGSHGVEHAILDGATVFGPTLHYCAVRVDTGPIVAEDSEPLQPWDTARAVWKRVDAQSVRLLGRVLPSLVASGALGDRLPARPQPADGSRFFHSTSLPREMELDSAWDRETILRHVRAYDHPRRRPAYWRCADGTRLRVVPRHRGIVIRTIELRR